MRKNRSVVFFIGNMSHSGGTERVLAEVANGLSKRGFHVSIVSLWGKGQPFFLLESAIRLYWAEERYAGFDIVGQLRFLSGVLKAEQADFLIDVDIILGFYTFLIRIKRPDLRWISWEHFNFYYHFSHNHCLRKMVRKLVSQRSDCLIVLTKEDREYYRQNLKCKCPVVQIYNPVSCEDILKKEEDRKIVFAAGRLTKVKGFDLLISSWTLLERSYPEWRLVIAGEGEERERLEKKTKKAAVENIILAGKVKDIEKYYKQAAFFVLSSRDEGFPMVLLEAMSYSLPVVSYCCKTGPKEIITDGEDGFLVEPGQVVEFAQKMELLMRDKSLRKSMGEKAAKSVRRFAADGILDQWEALLGQLACKP